MSSEVRSDWHGAATLLRVLASPLRAGIVLHLAEQPHTVGQLVDELDASQPLVSQHLKVLREACLVRGERQGREVRYVLMDEHVAHIVRDAAEHAREHASHTAENTAHHDEE